MGGQGLGNDGMHSTTVLADDRGYPLLPYLLTPYAEENPRPMARYNHAYRCTSIVVERVFGQLKLRFWCLHLTGGLLMMGPKKVARVVAACAMLHNVALRWSIPVVPAGRGWAPTQLCHPMRRRYEVLGNIIMLCEDITREYFAGR